MSEKWKNIHEFTRGGNKPTTRGIDEFFELIEDSDIDPEIAKEVRARLEETTGDTNIIFIFTENDYVVTGIHVPGESIDGEDGPVLMRGAGEKSIIAAFSNEHIMRKIEDLEQSPPGLQSTPDQAWVEELEKMAEDVKILMTTNPPEQWDDLLGEAGR